MSLGADIVQNGNFELAIEKLENREPLSGTEKEVVKVLLVKSVADGEGMSTDSKNETHCELLKKKMRTNLHHSANQAKPKCIDFKLLTRTSVTVERVFSHSHFILSDTHKNSTPDVFNTIVCLEVNCFHWSVHAVGKCQEDTAGTVGDAVSSEDSSLWHSVEN